MTRRTQGFAVRLHRRVLAEDPERGTSMIELFVAMIIMSICGAIFTGAVVTLYQANSSAQAVTNSARQVNQAYQTLDRMLRPAGAISTPGVSGGSWYVEISDTTRGTETCTQLRLNQASGVLQQRTWSTTSANPVPTAWRAIASSLTNGTAASESADQPFVLLKPSATSKRQRLTITLVAREGTASDPKTSRTSFTMTGLNTSVPQSLSAICQQVARP